jgi:hypothetical protein
MGQLAQEDPVHEAIFLRRQRAPGGKLRTIVLT